MDDLELSVRLFDELKRYSKETFLRDYPVYDIGFEIRIEENLVVQFTVLETAGKTIDDPGHPYLELRIYDPTIEDYNAVLEILINFDIGFENITGYQLNNNVELIPINQDKAYRTLKLYYEQISHQSIEELYQSILLHNIEMV